MTNRSETPARTAKRVRINEDDNEVQVIPIDTAESAPSIAARDHVKAAVASHPLAIQRIALALAKEYISLKAKFQQKTSTKEKLDGNTTFIPRSARVAFKLTAPPSIMETTAFKELSAAMDETTKNYTEFCKKSIASVAALVHEGMKKEITDLFCKGLFQLSSLLLTNQDPYRKEQPADYFCLFILADMDPSLFDATFGSKTTLQSDFMNKIQNNNDEPATQQTIVYPPTMLGPFALLKPIAYQLLKTVFVDSFTHFNTQMRENETKKCLEREATKFLTGAATKAAAMEIDLEPSADPKTIRDFVNKAVNEKTSKLQEELKKIRDTVKRPPVAKNSARGASSSSPQSAPSPKKKAVNNAAKKGNKNDEKKRNKEKGQQTTPRKPKGNSGARNENDSHSDKKRKSTNTGTPSKTKNAKRQRNPSNQS